MENRANPSISTRPVHQIIDPNDFSISLRPQQIVDPNDFTLFGNVEDCSSDENVPKLQDIEGDKLGQTATVDRNKSKSSIQCDSETTKSDSMTPVESIPANSSKVINSGAGLDKSVSLVSVGTNNVSKKHSSDKINTLGKVPRNTALFSEPLPNLRGDMTNEKSTLQRDNSAPAENSSLKALLLCDRLLPSPSTITKTALDPPIPTTNPLDKLTKSPRSAVKFKSCTLHPPKPGCSHPVQRDKPPGCKTVWVGGLPTGATEEMLREIFERCGKIVDLRLVEMFHHVKFAEAAAVDLAISLSGCRLAIGGGRDLSRSGMLFVDYVKSKEDQLEWECQQRKLQINKNHSPPPISCTDSDIAKVSEMVKRDDRFLEAVQLLSRWLEKEDYDKKNSEKIYSMIEETNVHAKRLQTEKKRQYEEMKRFRNRCRGKAEVISSQISHIDRLFAITSQKKVMDYFTDSQKTSLIQWKTEFLNYQEQIENLCTEVDDLSLLGADEELVIKKSKPKEKETLIENNTSLHAQIEISALETKHEAEMAAKNEEIQKLKLSLESLRKDLENAEELRMKQDKKITHLCRKKGDEIPQGPAKGHNVLEKKLQDCYEDLIRERQFVIALQTEISELKRWLADRDHDSKQLMKQMSDNEKEYQHNVGVLNKRLYDREVELGEAGRRMRGDETNQAEVPTTDTLYAKLANQRTELARLTKLRAEDKKQIETLKKEVRIGTINVQDVKTISAITSFLLIHPRGVEIHFIAQYVQRMDPTASFNYIQSVLRTFSDVFDNVENQWMLNVHAKSEPKSKWTDSSSSRDASSESSVGNSSQTKRTRSRTRPPRINRPVGTHPHSSMLASEVQPIISQAGQLVGANHLSGSASQTQPPTSQIGQPIGTSSLPSLLTSHIQPPTSEIGQSVGSVFQSSGLVPTIQPLLSLILPQSSGIQPQSSHIQPQSFQVQPQSSQIQPQSSQIQPQSSQIQPQSSQIQPRPSQIQPQSSHIPQSLRIQTLSFQIQPQSSQIQPRPSQIQPQSSQIQPRPSQIQPVSSHIPQSPQIQPQYPRMEVQDASENIELRTNGLTTFAEEIRLTNLIKKFPVSSRWSPQLLRRLQEICVFQNKNSLYLKASKRCSVRVVVPLVSDEEREIYKHTVTIPKTYPEEKWQRRCENSDEKEFSSDNVSATSYYPFSNQQKNVQDFSSPATPTTSEGMLQKACEIAGGTSDGVFKTPKGFPISTQNQKPPGFWNPQPKADAQKLNCKIVKNDAEEEDRLARIVSYIPNYFDWSVALQARLRFFRPVNPPQMKQQFFLRTLDGRQIEVHLPKIKLRKLAKLNAADIPDKYPEEYTLERKVKQVMEKRAIHALGEGKQEDYSNAIFPIAGNSCLPAKVLEPTMNLPGIKPEVPKVHQETLDASISFNGIASPEQATTGEPIGQTSTPVKSFESKKYDEVSTDSRPSNDFRTLQPQIPYRKPPMLIIQQDQQNQSVKKRHCLEDSQEPPAKVKKLAPDDSESCFGNEAQHSGTKTPLIDESVADKVSEVRKSSIKLQATSKPEDKAEISVAGDTEKINQEENTEKDAETELPGPVKSDCVASNVGECSQGVAKLDSIENKTLQLPPNSSGQSQSSKKHESTDAEPEGKGFKQNAIDARGQILRDNKKSSGSSKEFKKHREKTTDSRRTSSIRDDSKKRKYKSVASGDENSRREKESVYKLSDGGITKKHKSSKSKDNKIRRRELPKSKDESVSVDSGGKDKDASKKELGKGKVPSDSSKSLPKHLERSKNITSGTEAKPSIFSEGSNKESCDSERRTVEKLASSSKELDGRPKMLFNSLNERVTVDSQENCFNQDPKQPENAPKDLGDDSLASNKKTSSVDTRETSGALEKSNKREESARDVTKRSTDGHSSPAVEKSETSVWSNQQSRNISKNEDENAPKDLGEKHPKDSMVSSKQIIEARDKSSALEKSNKREDFVRDITKRSADGHSSPSVENSETSTGSSKRSENVSKNADENVPKDLGEKHSKETLVSSKKIIEARDKSSALEKSNKREDFVRDITKRSSDGHSSPSVENSATSTGSSKRSENVSKNADENVPKDLGEKHSKESLVSNKKPISVDARDKSSALEKSNKREDFVRDIAKRSADGSSSPSVENSATSTWSSKRSENVSKNADENLPKYLGEKHSKESLVSNKKPISVDARDKSSALEKSNKREDFVRDITKRSADGSSSPSVENSATSTWSSKRSENVSKNADENLPKDLGEKHSKESLVSNKKPISVDARDKSSALEKSNKREEFVRHPTGSSAEEQLFSMTSSGSSKRPRKIPEDEDEGLKRNAEQESRKNFDQKCEDFRKKYLESSKRKSNKDLGGKSLDIKVLNKKENEKLKAAMTFAEYLSSQQPKDSTDGYEFAKKTEKTHDGKQTPTESRSFSEKPRKRFSGREDMFPEEPEASSSKKTANEGDWEEVMQTLDYVPKKPSKPIKLPQKSQLKENAGQKSLEMSKKSSKPVELSQIKKKLSRSPSKPIMLPKIRVKSLEQMMSPSGWQNTSKTKKKASVGSNRKSADAGEKSGNKITSGPLKVSAREGGNEDLGVLLKHIEEIERSTESVPRVVDQEAEPPTPKIKAGDCEPEKKEFQMSVDEPKLEIYERALKKDLMETDDKEHIYEASSTSAQDLRNELEHLFDIGEEPKTTEVSSETSKKVDDYYCDTFLSSEDILRLAGEGPDMEFVK